MTGDWFQRSRSIAGASYPVSSTMLTMNISLAVFNLLPFPPLDGSKMLETFLPASDAADSGAAGAVWFHNPDDADLHGFFSAILSPIMDFVYYLCLLGVH